MLSMSGMDPRLRQHAEDTIAYAQRQGLRVNVVSVRRSEAEQRKLYENWKAGINRWPAEPPGQSAHQYGVAFDATVPPGQQEAWNWVRSAFGWRIYGNDPPHAEYPNWVQVVPYLHYS